MFVDFILTIFNIAITFSLIGAIVCLIVKLLKLITNHSNKKFN